MEESTVFQRIIEEKGAYRHRLFKIATQAVTVTIFTELISLFLTALIITGFRIHSLIVMAVVDTTITTVTTFFGLWMLAIWLDLR